MPGPRGSELEMVLCHHVGAGNQIVCKGSWYSIAIELFPHPPPPGVFTDVCLYFPICY